MLHALMKCMSHLAIIYGLDAHGIWHNDHIMGPLQEPTTDYCVYNYFARVIAITLTYITIVCLYIEQLLANHNN